jgi:hypothetical protein
LTDHVAVTRTDASNRVVLTLYLCDGPVRVELSPNRAALIGLDLLSLALEPVFRLRAERDPAGHGARPVDPAGG